MDKIEKNYVRISKENIINEVLWWNTVGVIQGLAYGLCAIPDRATLWDCEVFSEDAIVPVNCTAKRFDELKRILGELYPGMCTFGKFKEEAQA